MTATPRRVARRLLRAPMFTLIAVFTLALGIGANTAIFSVVRGVLLKPLPFDDPDTLVGVWHTAPGLGIPNLNMSPSTYLVYREEGRVFQDIGLWNGGAVSVTGSGEPERVQVLFVTDGTLTPPARQPDPRTRLHRRRRLAEDTRARAPEPRLLATQVRQRSRRSSASRSSSTASPREIIGVLPAGFRFLDQNPQLVLPFRFNRAELHVGNFSYQGVARLKPGMTLEQANADVARLIPIIPDRFPMPRGFTRKMFDDVKMGPNVRPLSVDAIGDIGRVLWVLLGTVGLVLLIACANVANLFLVRAEARQQELAIHAALGAGSRRIAWELLSESLTLALAGGVVGLGLAYAGIRTLVANAPDGLPRTAEIGIDPLVLLFTLGISLARRAPLRPAAGLQVRDAAPRVGAQRRRTPLERRPRASPRAQRPRRRRDRARGRPARRLRADDPHVPGDAPGRTRLRPPRRGPDAARVDSGIAHPETTSRRSARTSRSSGSSSRSPACKSVGVSSSITMDGYDSNDPIFVEDFPPPGEKLPPLRRFKWTAQNYFQTMGNPIVAGREMTWADVYSQASVVLISENFAREYWKEPAAAIGKRIRQTPSNPWRTIIGVVGNERDNGVVQPAASIIYWPLMIDNYYDNKPFAQRNLGYARADRPHRIADAAQGDPAGGVVGERQPAGRQRADARSDSRRLDGTDVVRAGHAGHRRRRRAAARRGRHLRRHRLRRAAAHEGNRHPHGARRGQPRRQRALRAPRHRCSPASASSADMVAAALLTRAMSTLLFGVSAYDPLTYAAVAIALGGTAVLASYLPARRAARVDPAEALRWEA